MTVRARASNLKLTETRNRCSGDDSIRGQATNVALKRCTCSQVGDPMAYHNTQPTFPLASAANEEELLQNHQASVAQFCHEQHLTVGSVEERDQNTRNEHKIFPDPEVHDEVQTCLHSWFNYFANAEVTSATADCSMYSPRYMPVRNGTAFKRFPPAFFHSPFPGVSPSPIVNPKPPSYYPTPQNSWVPDPISYSPCSIGWPSDAADETFRKRSRELKLPITDEQDDVYSSRFGATPSKLPRIPSLLMPESAFFVNSSSMGGIQESCCKMAGDAAPVVDIYVPSVCECGTAIVGVWYLNRPHYAHWFRHPRYAALRCMLEQNRCKNKYRPVCGIHSSVGLTPPAAKVSSAKDPHEYGSRAADNGTGAPVISEDDFAAVMSPEDLLAPKFMSLMCMFQFVKHLDAVGIMYPTAVQAGSSAPPLMKLDHVKISAHIDCERSKGFVQYRWYGADANELADDLSSGDKSSKKAVGCCCIGHWKRKPPGLGPSKSVISM